MDVEAGRVLLTCECCPFCAAEFNKLKTKYRLLYYTVLVLSTVVVFVFVTNILVTLRLLQTEQQSDLLKDRVRLLEDKLNSEFTVSSELENIAKEEEKTSNTVNNSLDAHISNVVVRTKREAKIRHNGEGKQKKKRCKNCLPAVQIEGTGAFSRTADKTDLGGKWATPDWLSQTDKKMSKLFDTSTVNRNGQIKVTEDGLYLVYAQMTLFGSKKRGYYVKKEPFKRTVASCIYYSDQEGTGKGSISDQEGTTCSTLKLLNLSEGDNLYIEEIDGNSKALYSDITAIFGLVKIGSLASS